MKIYAPGYYKNFKCIADRCTHSCCVGWEIDIDERTLEKYRTLSGSYAEDIRASIIEDGTPHFALGAGERCPHLDECGLCRIISNVGEEYLSDICREHPRFYNFTDVCEVGIGMSCPEAARIILDSADYAEILEVGDVDAKPYVAGFDAKAERAEIYAIMGDASRAYAERLSQIYQRYSVEAGEDAAWIDVLAGLEYLDVEHKRLFMSYSAASRPDGCEEYLERFLAYLIYRHCTEAIDFEDLCARLSFCLFCERLLASLICSEGAKTKEEVEALSVIISEELEYSEENTYTLMGLG